MVEKTLEERIAQLERDYADLAELRGHERQILATANGLERAIEMFAAVLNIPKHAASCSNQNVLDPLGAYRGANECGCTGVLHVPLNQQIVEVHNEVLKLSKEVATIRSILQVDGVTIGNGPLQQAQPEQPFETAADLIAAIEKLFDCRPGFYGPYADGPVSPPEKVGERQEREGMLYNTLVLIIPSNSRANREAAYHAMYTDFLNLYRSSLRTCEPPIQKPLLFWRYAAAERFQEEPEPRTRRWKLRTRVAIPDADWSVCKFQQADGERAKMLES